MQGSNAGRRCFGMGADARRSGCRRISEPLTVCVVITIRRTSACRNRFTGSLISVVRPAAQVSSCFGGERGSASGQARRAWASTRYRVPFSRAGAYPIPGRVLAGGCLSDTGPCSRGRVPIRYWAAFSSMGGCLFGAETRFRAWAPIQYRAAFPSMGANSTWFWRLRHELAV